VCWLVFIHVRAIEDKMEQRKAMLGLVVVVVAAAVEVVVQ